MACWARKSPATPSRTSATFLARLPIPEVSWVDEHLLVIAGGSRRNQAEPDGPASLANQTIKVQALQISAGRVYAAPNRRPGGRAQITPLWAAEKAGSRGARTAQIGGSWSRLTATVGDLSSTALPDLARLAASGGQAGSRKSSYRAAPAMKLGRCLGHDQDVLHTADYVRVPLHVRVSVPTPRTASYGHRAASSCKVHVYFAGVQQSRLGSGAGPGSDQRRGPWMVSARCCHRCSSSTDIPDNVPESRTAVSSFPGPRQASWLDVPSFHRPVVVPGNRITASAWDSPRGNPSAPGYGGRTRKTMPARRTGHLRPDTTQSAHRTPSRHTGTNIKLARAV
jgi:hypothetical protein